MEREEVRSATAGGRLPWETSLSRGSTADAPPSLQFKWGVALLIIIYFIADRTIKQSCSAGYFTFLLNDRVLDLTSALRGRKGSLHRLTMRPREISDFLMITVTPGSSSDENRGCSIVRILGSLSSD